MERATIEQGSQSLMSVVRQGVLRLARPVHKRLRQGKLDLFFSLSANARRNNLLDVGGATGIDSEFLPLYQAFRAVTVVNLDPSPDRHILPHVRRMVADGCRLPFANASFDWVFSNAVIEHVGGWEHQERFAKEIQRVASRGFFVTTPNKFFPIEPHVMLPFYQFLPVSVQKKVAPLSPGYLRKYEEINLLSAGQMKRLFPSAKVVAVGFPVLGNSLVAYHCGE